MSGHSSPRPLDQEYFSGACSPPSSPNGRNQHISSVGRATSPSSFEAGMKRADSPVWSDALEAEWNKTNAGFVPPRRRRESAANPEVEKVKAEELYVANDIPATWASDHDSPHPRNHARSGTIAIPGARLHNYYGKDVARPTLPNDHARPRHSSRSTSGCPADCEGRCSDPELQFALEFDCRKARCTPPTSAPPREEEKALQNRTWTVAANRHRKPEGRSGLGDGCEW